MLKFSVNALLYMKPKTFVKYLSGNAVSTDNISQDIVFYSIKQPLVAKMFLVKLSIKMTTYFQISRLSLAINLVFSPFVY